VGDEVFVNGITAGVLASGLSSLAKTATSLFLIDV